MNSRSRSVLKDIVIVVAGVLIIWGALAASFGTINPFYVVSSGSMVPELNVYDIIVVQGHHPFEKIEIGDIIVFDRPSDHNRVIVHRVVSIIDDDPFTVRTQGDANPASMPGTDFPITAEEYIGTVVYVIPQAGYITRIFAIQIWGIPLNYIIVAAIVGVMIIRTFSGKKTPKNNAPAFSAGKIPSDSEYSSGASDKKPDRQSDTGHEKDDVGSGEPKQGAKDSRDDVGSGEPKQGVKDSRDDVGSGEPKQGAKDSRDDVGTR